MQTLTDQPTEQFDVMGTVVRPIADGAATGERWEAIESTVAPGAGSPPHTLDYDKAFYVVDGEVTLYLDGDERRARAGESALAPAGVVHNYRNLSGAPARMIVITSGAHHVPFLRGMSELTSASAPEADALARHAQRHGVRLLTAS